MKQIAVLGVIIVAVLALAFVGLNQSGFINLASGSNPSAQEKNEVIQIGIMTPLTGDAAVYGENCLTALNLAEEEINSSGGILGRKIELIYEDSKCNANEGVKAVNSLVNLKGLKFIVAADCSGPTLAAAPIAVSAKSLYIVAVATNPAITSMGKYVFRTGPNDNQQGKDLAKIIYSQGFRNTAVLSMNNSYGQGLSEVFEKEFEKRSGKIAIIQEFSQTDSDFRTQLLKIKSSNPDSLFLVGYVQSNPLIIKQLNELKIKIQIFSSDTFMDDSIIKAVGNEAEGVIFTAYAVGTSEKFIEFKENYLKKYGKEYGTYGDYAYDSLYVLKAGIEQAKSFDPEILKNSLYGLDYIGITGETKFDSSREVDKPFGIWIVKDGKFVPYK